MALLAAGMKRLEYITIQIRGICKGLVDLRAEIVDESNRKKLEEAVGDTAKCIFCFGVEIIHPSEDNLQHLMNRVEKAHHSQSLCLSEIRSFDNATILHIGGILADLTRIVNGVAEEAQ